MAKLYLHAGMNKTGSSSIQNWLSVNAETLKSRHNLHVLKAETAGVGCHLQRVKSGQNSASNNYIQAYQTLDKESRQNLIDALMHQLRGRLDEGNNIVLSSEAFYGVLINADRIFIKALEDVTQNHAINICYYVRPQHAALEAGWCQWGFRGKRTPGKFINDYKKVLYYYENYQQLKKAAPGVDINIRPYRRDLLDSGDVVMDFVNKALGLPMDDFRPVGQWLNTSLPLGVVNILRILPDHNLWSSAHDNSRLDRLKEIITAAEFKEDKRLGLSSAILRNYCCREFEESNIKLIRELGWNTPGFIEPPQAGEEATDSDLSKLDDLWKARAGAQELTFISQLIKHLFKEE